MAESLVNLARQDQVAMTMPEHDREFDILLDRLCEDLLSDQEWQQIVDLLTHSESCRRRYLDYMELHATLWSGVAVRAGKGDSHLLCEAREGPRGTCVPTGRQKVAVTFSDPADCGDRKLVPGGRSPVLGFLSDVDGTGWSSVSALAMLFSALAALLMVAVIVAVAQHGLRDHDIHGHDIVASRPLPPLVQPSQTEHSSPHLSATPVAYLARSYNCNWSDPDLAISDGDSLRGGQQLSLRSGLAEIVFASGTRVILQGPAVFLPESQGSASLFSGKVTVRAETPSAKGFTVRTPGMKTIDIGTEFGLEVAPTGLEQVHVFRGEVVVAPSSPMLPRVAPQRLFEQQGIELNPGTKGVKLVANNGERFARSLDEAQNKRHVVAYWRFEDHPVGVVVPESQEGKAPIRGSLDSSINGNDLYAWNRGTQPRFSSDVPAATVPQSGERNRASLDNSVPPTGVPTRDLYTMSAWSRPSPVDLQAITPVCWTIEASVKPAKLKKEFQVIVVRDGINVSSADPKLTPLAFQVTPDRHFEVLFCDVDKRFHKATAEAVTVEENHWYHVAASSDGHNLKLFVDSLDGKGYLLWAITGLPDTGSTALARGTYPTSDPMAISAGTGYPYIWSVGRGFYAGHVGNWFQGWIDEVRICDEALDPQEFLFAPPAGKNGHAGTPAR
jgi:hypothetical protein